METPYLILPIAHLCKDNYFHEQQEIQTQAINLAQTTLVSSDFFIYDGDLGTWNPKLVSALIFLLQPTIFPKKRYVNSL